MRAISCYSCLPVMQVVCSVSGAVEAFSSVQMTPQERLHRFDHSLARFVANKLQENRALSNDTCMSKTCQTLRLQIANFLNATLLLSAELVLKTFMLTLFVLAKLAIAPVLFTLSLLAGRAGEYIRENTVELAQSAWIFYKASLQALPITLNTIAHPIQSPPSPLPDSSLAN